MPRTIATAQPTAVDTIVDTARAVIERPPGQPASAMRFFGERAQRAQVSGGGAVLGEPVPFPTLSFTLGQVSAGPRRAALIAGLQALEAIFDDLEQGNPI